MEAAGAIFYSQATHRVLFLLRNNTKTKNTWGIVGGKLAPGENIMSGLAREIKEELGFSPSVIKQIPLETFTSVDEEFKYHSFIFITDSEFIPILNSEHSGYAWVTLEKYPRPLHPGVWNTLNVDVIMEKIKSLKDITSW